MSQPAASISLSSSLIVFTRYPQAGQTKTRLIPALGAAGAATLQRQMTEHLIEKLQPLCQGRSLYLSVHFAGGSQSQLIDWLGPDVALTPQCAGSLGEKLIYATTQAFLEGRQQVIIIGSDCPAIGSKEIDRALASLKSFDVVLGPAADGGYYLIALKAAHCCLFKGIPWGTNRVFETTQAIACKHQLSVALLDVLADIDRPEDLLIWEAQKESRDRAKQTTSSIPATSRSVTLDLQSQDCCLKTTESLSNRPQNELKG